MAKRSFKQFVEQELGTVPKFFIYAVLECTMILLLFVDGFLAFFANEFAKFFELPVPCLLCTRIDHVFVRRNADFYYNDSICMNHKKNVSSLAYCHAHKKMSDIRNMCESCLLSFAIEKESDFDTYKSLLGILHKDIELFVDEDHEVHLSLPAGKKDDQEVVVVENSNDDHSHRCSCCWAPLKAKPSYSKGKISSQSSSIAPPLPSPSPKVAANRNLDLSHIKYMELKLNSDETEGYVDENDRSRGITLEKSLSGDKDASVPLLLEGDEDDKTPKGNRFFGIPLSDSALNSPRWTITPRKPAVEKPEFGSESGERQQQQQQQLHVGNETDQGDILHHLKRQVRMDRKSLMALYMELDEERSASAVAANNAMAMITRLQAEKAAVQMEALQYQRMMEEQAEYDQEALQEMNNCLIKRDEEIKELEDELEAYRQHYGCLKEVDFDGQEKEDDEVSYQVLETPASYYSSDIARVEFNDNDDDGVVGGGGPECFDKPKKGCRQLGRLQNLEKKQLISSEEGVLSRSSNENSGTYLCIAT